MQSRLSELWYDEAGVVTVEYALLLSVLIVGMFAVWTGLRDSIAVAVNSASDSLDGALIARSIP